MRNRARLAIAGIVLLGGCSRSTRTVVVAPTPQNRAAVRAAESDNRGAPSTAATLGVPPGHLPDPGECRVWIPGTPPGRQPGAKSRPCPGIAGEAPAGSWIVYRPTRDRKLVHVRVVDARQPGIVTVVHVFDLHSGRLLRDVRPEDDEAKPDNTRGNDRRNDDRRNKEHP